MWILLQIKTAKIIYVNEETMLIARSPKAHITLQSDWISRAHASLLAKEEKLYIKDLNSRNGVFVSGIRYVYKELQHGDLLTVGKGYYEPEHNNGFLVRYVPPFIDLTLPEYKSERSSSPNFLDRFFKSFSSPSAPPDDSDDSDRSETPEKNDFFMYNPPAPKRKRKN